MGIEVETKKKLWTPQRSPSFFVFVQFQSNSDFMPFPHNIHIISRNQGKKFLFYRQRYILRWSSEVVGWGWGGWKQERVRVSKILLHTHIPLMYAVSTCGIIKHWANKKSISYFSISLWKRKKEFHDVRIKKRENNCNVDVNGSLWRNQRNRQPSFSKGTTTISFNFNWDIAKLCDLQVL